MDLNARVPRLTSSRFSMTPRAEIPRSTFVTTHSIKTTFDADLLVPFFVDEVLPGDVHQGNMTFVCRLFTLLFPIMDSITIDSFFFFVPNRLVWTNWKKFMGERKNPADSISYTIPTVTLPANLGAGTTYDYMGIPISTTVSIAVNNLPARGYFLIWDEWFRDENLQDSITVDTGDGPDSVATYSTPRVRNKRPDYFTSALPWPLKGGVDVTLPMNGSAPVTGIAHLQATGAATAGNPTNAIQTVGGMATGWSGYWDPNTTAGMVFRASTSGLGATPQIYADLSSATGATINALRLAVQTQRLLERDARSGTRYTEMLLAHFGVQPEDARLQRPEYIGGGTTMMNTQAIPQTSASGLSGGTTSLGSLSAQAQASDNHSYRYNATEHGYIIGLINARATVSYQQGLHRMWTRSTRYDFYLPVFANLGEQAIRTDEIWVINGLNPTVWGYQERWAEYRDRHNKITGVFRSNATGTLHAWHLAESFSAAPALNNAFIKSYTPIARTLATASSTLNFTFLFDSVFHIKTTRAMPMFSIPGEMDRF